MRGILGGMMACHLAYRQTRRVFLMQVEERLCRKVDFPGEEPFLSAQCGQLFRNDFC
jgi:hypothetical protein